MVTNANTIEAFLNWESIFGVKIKFNGVDSMLLLQPKGQPFICSLTEVFDQKIPHIFVWVEKQTISDVSNTEDLVNTLL